MTSDRRRDRAGSPQEVTDLLRAHENGDRTALERLVPLVYDDLRRLAHHQLQGLQRPTLNTTGVVHEAYFKLADCTRAAWRDRGHFCAVAARAMRQIVIDYARRSMAAKRGGGRRDLPLDETQIAIEDRSAMLVELNQALERLGAVDERLIRIIECRFFAGLTEEETATALRASRRTIQRDWIRARAWLRREMGRESG